MKHSKKSIFLFILLVIVSTSLGACGSKTKDKNDFVSKSNIRSFKIHNIKCEEKEIKSTSTRNKIIDLLNSVKITKSDVEPRMGVGYGVIITYDDGKKFSASYLASTICYSNDDKKFTWCDIDKNIVDDLRSFYDKN